MKLPSALGRAAKSPQSDRSDGERRSIEGQPRWAVVTGASSGIGRAFATELAGRGWNLILVARNAPVLETLSESLSRQFDIRTAVLVADLSSRTETRALIVACEEYDNIRMLVHSAGSALTGSFHELDEDELLAELDLLVVSSTLLTRGFARRFHRQSGSIILVSSLAGCAPGPWMASYAASKAYLNSLAVSLAAEYESSPVEIIAVVPGLTDTPLARDLFRNDPGLEARLRRSLTPNQVAKATLGRRDIGPLFLPSRADRASRFVLNHLLGPRMRGKLAGDFLKKAIKPEAAIQGSGQPAARSGDR